MCTYPMVFGEVFALNDVRVFHSLSNVRGNTLLLKYGAPDQTDRIFALFQTKMAKAIPYSGKMLDTAHTYMA